MDMMFGLSEVMVFFVFVCALSCPCLGSFRRFLTTSRDCAGAEEKPEAEKKTNFVDIFKKVG